MNNFIFENATRTFFGKGCVKEYLRCLLSRYGQNVMLAYGGGSIKRNGVYDEVVSILKAGGKNIIEFSGIPSNPTYSKVLEGARLARENKVDVILAVGGGSVMDYCKAISLAAVYPGDIWENFWARTGIIDVSPLPLGVIVTVSGTGSEMNGGAVITNEEKRIKTGRDYPKLNPKFAMLDPTYTRSVPHKQLISGAFDTLSHIMETYFSEPDEENVSDDIAEALMRGVIRDMRAITANPEDDNARGNLMWAATMAENRVLKLGKKTDFQAHQIEHQLGAYTNCNHGFGLAVIHPAYYRHICPAGAQKFKRFALRVWQIEDHGQDDLTLARKGVEALADFIREIGLPTTLRELGMTDRSVLKEIAGSCAIVPGSYKRMTHEEILEILNECF